jgi:peptide/nickel transport system permease protein
MISQTKDGLTIQALATVAPVVMIALFTIGTNLMTDGLARAVSGVDRGTGGR